VKRAVAILDKTFPPEEAFIDGLLCPRSRSSDARIYALVTGVPGTARVRRWHGSPCLGMLPRRRGRGRFTGAIHVLGALIMLKRRWRGASDVTILARNDPGYLVAALLGRTLLGFGRVVYQTTFPHEEESAGSLKGAVMTWVLRRTLSRVDCVIVGTPDARARLDALAPTRDAVFIPMCLNGDFLGLDRVPLEGPVRFLYSGTHLANRRLEVIFEAAWIAYRRGAPFTITSIGATEDELLALRRFEATRVLEEHGVLTLSGRIPRGAMPEVMRGHHVGLSLLPPDPLFVESTPTKLIEYLGAGLPILASTGIPFQEHAIRESLGGTLVPFETEAMACAIEITCEQRDELPARGRRGYAYARDHLRCERFRDALDHALWGPTSAAPGPSITRRPSAPGSHPSGAHRVGR
jgi:glycosyltransferase involved in cell wall biosynthesis